MVLKILSDKEKILIHQAAREILKDTGIRVRSRVIYEMLLSEGGEPVAHYHGLPSASWALSDAAMLDSQASAEKLLTAMAHILTNVSFVWGRYTDFLNRSNRGMWQRAGSVSLEEKAEQKVNKILGKKPEYYLTGLQIEKLEAVEQKWKQKLNG